MYPCEIQRGNCFSDSHRELLKKLIVFKSFIFKFKQAIMLVALGRR